jgi:hypothetical protein
VQDDGELRGFRNLHLADERGSLDFHGRIFCVVVVQADFADGNAAGILRKRGKFFIGGVIGCRGFLRMDSGRGEDLGQGTVEADC